MADLHSAGTPGSYTDVAVIGGGQSALAVGYYLRRTGLSFVLLDNADIGPPMSIRRATK